MEQPVTDTPSRIEGRRPASRPGLPLLRLSTPWRKVLADLWANKTRTILAVLSIAIGVFAVGSVAGTFMTLNRDLNRGYQAVNPADATIYVWPNFDEDLITTARHTPGVVDVQGVGVLSVRARVSADTWRTITLYAIDELDRMRVNKVRPDSGAWPAGDRELLLERSSKQYVTQPEGQPLEVELADGSRRTLRISGTVHDAAGIPAVFSDDPGGFITFDTLEWLGGARGYSRMYVTVEQRASEEQIRAVTDEVADRITRSGRDSFVSVPPPGESPVQSGVDAMSTVLNMLAILMVFLSMFLIVNTVAALLLQQRRQIGVMKAVGAKTQQIVVMYLAYVLGLGLIALALAVPLGALWAFKMAGFLSGLLNFNPGAFELSANAVIFQAIIAVSMPTLAALAPVLGGTRISVREAISNPGLGQGRFGSSWVDRILERVRFLNRPLLLALRNTFRRKGRLSLTLVTLSLAGAIFVAVGSTQQAFSLQTDEFMNYFGEDVRLSFDRGYRIDQVRQIARDTPGVVRTELWARDSIHRVRPDGSEGDTMQVIAPEWGSDLMRPRLMRGRWLLQGDENALVVDTRFIEKEADINVGSRVTMRLNDKDSAWLIVGVVPQLGNGDPIVYTNYATMSRLLQNVGWTGDLRVVADAHDPAAQKALADRLLQHFRDHGIRVRTTQTSAEFRAALDVQFGQITPFLMIMAVEIAIVGGIGLMGTMSMNVVERTREIGVLRAIGASDQDIQLIIVAEGLLIGLISWALAALAALPISRLLSDGIGVAFLNNPLPRAYALNSAAIWLGIVLVLSALASALPAWRASRLTVSEVLAYE